MTGVSLTYFLSPSRCLSLGLTASLCFRFVFKIVLFFIFIVYAFKMSLSHVHHFFSSGVGTLQDCFLFVLVLRFVLLTSPVHLFTYTNHGFWLKICHFDIILQNALERSWRRADVKEECGMNSGLFVL